MAVSHLLPGLIVRHPWVPCQVFLEAPRYPNSNYPRNYGPEQSNFSLHGSSSFVSRSSVRHPWVTCQVFREAPRNPNINYPRNYCPKLSIFSLHGSFSFVSKSSVRHPRVPCQVFREAPRNPYRNYPRTYCPKLSVFNSFQFAWQFLICFQVIGWTSAGPLPSFSGGP